MPGIITGETVVSISLTQKVKLPQVLLLVNAEKKMFILRGIYIIRQQMEAFTLACCSALLFDE